VDREAAHVTDVRQTAEQFQTLDERPADRDCAVPVERRQGAHTARRAL
jgi:hypothetical protein